MSNRSRCRYYARGYCRSGLFCRFSHDTNNGSVSANFTNTNSNVNSLDQLQNHFIAIGPIIVNSTSENENNVLRQRRRRQEEAEEKKEQLELTKRPRRDKFYLQRPLAGTEATECLATSSDNWKEIGGNTHLPSVARMITECMEMSQRLHDTTNLSPTMVTILDDFQTRQINLQAAGISADRKARDKNTGIISCERQNSIIKAHKDALFYVMAAAHDPSPLTIDVVLQAHSILMGGPTQNGGIFRTVDVRVGTTQFPPSSEVSQLLSEVLNNYVLMENSTVFSPFARAAYLLFGICEIHAFTDGNGRLSRLFANYALQRKVRWTVNSNAAKILGLPNGTRFEQANVPFCISLANTPAQRAVYIGAVKANRSSDSLIPNVSTMATVLLTSVYHAYCVLKGIQSSQALGMDIDEMKSDYNEKNSSASPPAPAIVEPEQDRCIVCLEEKIQIRTSCCRKPFHLLCLYKWVHSSSKTCPSCRHDITFDQAVHAPPPQNSIPSPRHTHFPEQLWHAMFDETDEDEENESETETDYDEDETEEMENYWRANDTHTEDMEDTTAYSETSAETQRVSRQCAYYDCRNLAAIGCRYDCCGRHCHKYGCSRHSADY